MTRLALATTLLLVLGVVRADAQREPGWEVRVPERIEVALGETVALPISIAVDRGLTVSKDAPVIVDVVAPTGVTIRKSRLGRADAVDPEADAPRFQLPVKASTAGEHVVKLRLRLWLCGGRSCRPLDIRRQATVVVAASQVPPAPPVSAGPAPKGR